MYIYILIYVRIPKPPEIRFLTEDPFAGSRRPALPAANTQTRQALRTLKPLPLKLPNPLTGLLSNQGEKKYKP